MYTNLATLQDCKETSSLPVIEIHWNTIPSEHGGENEHLKRFFQDATIDPSRQKCFLFVL